MSAAAIVERFFAAVLGGDVAISRRFEFKVTSEETMEVGDGRVVVRIGAHFLSLNSGRTADFPIAEIYTISNGQIMDIDVCYKDPGAIRLIDS